jgi:hypothetical protein
MESFLRYMLTTKGARVAPSEVPAVDVAWLKSLAGAMGYTLIELKSGVEAPVESLGHASSLYGHLRDVRLAVASKRGLPLPQDWGDGMVLGRNEAYLVSHDGKVWRCEDFGANWTKRLVLSAEAPSAFAPSEYGLLGHRLAAVPTVRPRRVVVPAFGDEEPESRYREQPGACHVLMVNGTVDTVLAAEQLARRLGDDAVGWHPVGRVSAENVVQFGLMDLEGDGVEPHFEASVGVGPVHCEVSVGRPIANDFYAFVRFVAERRDGGSVESDPIRVSDFRDAVMAVEREVVFLPPAFEAKYSEFVDERRDEADSPAMGGP